VPDRGARYRSGLRLQLRPRLERAVHHYGSVRGDERTTGCGDGGGGDLWYRLRSRGDAAATRDGRAAVAIAGGLGRAGACACRIRSWSWLAVAEGSAPRWPAWRRNAAGR